MVYFFILKFIFEIEMWFLFNLGWCCLVISYIFELKYLGEYLLFLYFLVLWYFDWDGLFLLRMMVIKVNEFGLKFVWEFYVDCVEICGSWCSCDGIYFKSDGRIFLIILYCKNVIWFLIWNLFLFFFCMIVVVVFYVL